MDIDPTSRRPWIAALLALALAAVHAAGLAQGAAADTKQMIEALKPAKTRSLRNLSVQERPAEAAATGSAGPAGAAFAPAASPAPAAKPSLSMAIQFDFDSARIRAESSATLDHLAAALQSPALSASRFQIEGHTDAKGSAAYNLRLSQQRADEVRRYLLAHGAAAERLSAVGRGMQEPANPGDPNAAENRRVRIVNID